MKDERTIAARLHDSYQVQSEVQNIIFEAFEKYEPEVYNREDFEISFGADDYDNSIEIYFKMPLPYPYEPCHEIRKIIYALGFGMVYWNFLEDKTGDTYDEIRGYEPRHRRMTAKGNEWKSNKYGYVDDRFNEEEWCRKYRK